MSDGTNQDVTGRAVWSSSNEVVAIVGNGATSGGRVTPLGDGATTILAIWRAKQGSVSVAVTDP